MCNVDQVSYMVGTVQVPILQQWITGRLLISLNLCSGSALLGDLLGVSRSRERDLSVLSIYPRFFLRVFIVYCRILFCYMIMSVDCFGLVVSTAPPPFHLATSVLWCWSWEKEGEELKWSLAFKLYNGSFPCAQLPGPVHTARLGWFVVSYSFVFPWAVESSPLQLLALA